ncbi:hypothetical protein LXL04_014045 [Taraxacum kok-saghyz]
MAQIGVVATKKHFLNQKVESRSFENSYIPENPRTPKPLTFSKNRLQGAKNRSILSPVAKKVFRKNNFFFSKTLHMGNFFFFAYMHVLTNFNYYERFGESRSRFFERNNGLGDIGNWGSSRVESNLGLDTGAKERFLQRFEILNIASNRTPPIAIPTTAPVENPDELSDDGAAGGFHDTLLGGGGEGLLWGPYLRNHSTIKGHLVKADGSKPSMENNSSSTMEYCLIKNLAKENPVGKNSSEGKKSAVYS